MSHNAIGSTIKTEALHNVDSIVNDFYSWSVDYWLIHMLIHVIYDFDAYRVLYRKKLFIDKCR